MSVRAQASPKSGSIPQSTVASLKDSLTPPPNQLKWPSLQAGVPWLQPPTPPLLSAFLTHKIASHHLGTSLLSNLILFLPSLVQPKALKLLGMEVSWVSTRCFAVFGLFSFSVGLVLGPHLLVLRADSWLALHAVITPGDAQGTT